VKLSCLVSILFLIMCSAGLAQDSSDPVEIPHISDNILPSLVKMVVAVGVVIVLIYISVVVLKRISLGRAGRHGARGALEILDRSYFSPKSFLCLAKVGDKMIVLGVTESNINMLADVSDQDFKAATSESRTSDTKSFSSYLKQARTHLLALTAKSG
jgi:flagellar biogenesis protein FliO